MDVLGRAAEFLAFVNSEESVEGLPTGARREVWTKEVGRWLKAVGVSSPPDKFKLYWDQYSDQPLFRRRDAHPLNWLVASGGRLLAVDLEAIGWRPLGYEIGQSGGRWMLT